jgi:hypothetical protein
MSNKKSKPDPRSGAQAGTQQGLEALLGEYVTGEQFMVVASEIVDGILEGLVMELCHLDEMAAVKCVEDAIAAVGPQALSSELIRTVLVQAMQFGRERALVLPPGAGIVNPMGPRRGGPLGDTGDYA